MDHTNLLDDIINFKYKIYAHTAPDKMDTKSIPFSVALPKEPASLDSMTRKEFNEVMEKGLSQAKADQSRPTVDVIADLRRELQ